MNVADMFSQATVEGLKLAYETGVDLFIMEPLRGGRLVNNVPALIRDKYFKLGKNYSVIEWCFRWLYDSPIFECHFFQQLIACILVYL